MLSGEPRISQHAFERGRERLGLTANAFAVWVKATYSDWLAVNAKYLTDRGLDVSASGANHFITPFTFRTSVALCVSPDGWIRTVMSFPADPK